MQPLGRLALLGGDERQIEMAQALERLGWETAVWGLGEGDSAADWREAIAGADAVILPLPATSDGVRLHCPLDSGASLRFSVLLEQLPSGSCVLGGKLPAAWREGAVRRQISVEDYYDSEILQMRNALPTAEGALYLAMQTLPVTVDGLSVAVTGYGRIASLLAEKLYALGASVTVYARKKRDLTHAELRHLHTVCLTGEGERSSLCRISSDCRMIFNTVPCRIFTEPVLRCLPRQCILMELASAPGGFDPVCAERLGLRWILASALPGKYYPETAGRILAQTVSELLPKILSQAPNHRERDDK